MVISPSLKACGNSSRRNFSSSATLIFAAVMPPLPSIKEACYIRLSSRAK
jgi:hypothetical protein